MKGILKNYTLTIDSPIQATIALSNVDGFNPERVLAIINANVGRNIFCPAAGLVGVWTGASLVVAVNTTGMNNTDLLQVIYDSSEAVETDFFPQYSPRGGYLTDMRSRLDGAGSLVTRSGVLTDEGSYYAHFDGTGLAITSAGDAIFDNTSDKIYFDTSELDIHVNEYVKLSTDLEAAYTQIYEFGTDEVGSFISLTENYKGSSGTGTIDISVMLPKVGAGCTLSVAGGYAILGSGTTDASEVELERDVDYLPVIKSTRIKISQRIVNQEIQIGLYDEASRYWALFKFSGTNDRYVICETAHARSGTPSANDKEITEVYLQQTKTTENDLELWIEAGWQDIKFKIDDTVVATHKRIIFHPTDIATSVVKIINGVGVASNTNVSCFYDKVKNFNRVDTGLGDTDSLLLKNGTPRQGDTYMPVRNVPIKTYNVSFAKAIANNVDSEHFTLLRTGTGQTVNQANGNLVLVAGTTANQETIIRSKFSIDGLLRLLYSTILSQRIINNNFYAELVDVIGDGLAFSITNTTTIVVTIPDNPFNAENIGQGITIGNITGAAGIPIRGVIAAVSGTSVTFTVAGWPASGSGTLSLWGWNNNTILYTGATVTNMTLNAQRKGYQDVASTLTCSTTTTGHIVAENSEDNALTVGDGVVASGAGIKFTPRGDRFTNVPDKDAKLFLQIRMLNGTTNPASSTTWTLGFVRLEDVVVSNTSINSIKFHGFMQSLPVAVQGTVPVSGTVTANNNAGTAAHSAAASGNPVQSGGVCKTAIETSLVDGDACRHTMTTADQLITKDFATSENDLKITGIKTDTTDLVFAGQAGASICNYMTAIQFVNNHATVDTEIVVKDGSTVIWRGYADNHIVSTPAVVSNIIFPTPLKGTANTAMNIACITTGSNTIINAQGFKAF